MPVPSGIACRGRFLQAGIQLLGSSRLVNRNISAGARRTSMRLEPEIWEGLNEICAREQLDLNDLVRNVERAATSGGRTSAVRVYVLQYFRAAATAEGHAQAGHGPKPPNP